jgi:hypothetical protein
MRTSAQRRGMALPILCLFVLAIAACDKKASAVAADPNDPNSPAVVKEPAPILVGDTLKPKVPLVDTARFRQTVRNEYAIMAMMMISHDGRSLVTEFEPNATIAYPDSTVQSSVRIAKYLIDFAASKSVMDFQRASEKFQLTDSAATDSGRYRIVSKRPGADSIITTGTYAATWRRHADGSFTVLADRLTPTPTGKKPK